MPRRSGEHGSTRRPALRPAHDLCDRASDRGRLPTDRCRASSVVPCYQASIKSNEPAWGDQGDDRSGPRGGNQGLNTQDFRPSGTTYGIGIGCLMDVATRFTDVLRKLQAARLAEPEALGDLAAVLSNGGAAPLPLLAAATSQMNGEPCLSAVASAKEGYLSAKQLADVSRTRRPRFATWSAAENSSKDGTTSNAAAASCSRGRPCENGWSSSRSPRRRRFPWRGIEGMGIRSKSGKLFLDFRWKSQRCREFTGLEDTRENRRRA